MLVKITIATMLIERRYFLITELLLITLALLFLGRLATGQPSVPTAQLDITYYTTAMQLSTLTGFAGKPDGIRQNDRFLLPSSGPILGADVF
jgi:hypothetical protein